MTNFNAEQFAGRLKELRERAGLSQKALADKAGLGQRSISNWEQGMREPSWSNVLALCKALGVDCTAFTEEPGEQTEPRRGRPRKATEEMGPSEEKPAKRTRKKKGDA